MDFCSRPDTEIQLSNPACESVIKIISEGDLYCGLSRACARKVLEKETVRVKVGTLAFHVTCNEGPENLLNLCSHSVLAVN